MTTEIIGYASSVREKSRAPLPFLGKAVRRIPAGRPRCPKSADRRSRPGRTQIGEKRFFPNAAREAPAVAICLAVALAGLLASATMAFGQEPERTFVGSVQLDYLVVPTDSVARDHAFDGATVELSLKLVTDHSDNITSSVKVCVACHGMEIGMAFFDLRVSDVLNVRVGRFTPSFGEFPLRHDPANHRTSDKPLPYDMGRMLRIREWNMSVLPAPWVDNGVEVSGTHFVGDARFDYAVFSVGGPRAGRDPQDFDFTRSRNPQLFYIDNNSRPALGGHVGAEFDLSETIMASVGLSVMGGTYDPDNQHGFLIAGIDALWRIDRLILRAEYLFRRTEMSLGDDPYSRFRYGPGEDGVFSDYFVKHGFYIEAERPVGKFDFVARFDGLRRVGNVVSTSPLRSTSTLLRYTGAVSYRIHGPIRIKTSVEVYDFSDFSDELAIHAGLAGSF
ncbi:MAG: hypothetical protein MJE77_10260 [Proteobacteria bacterium]|nr:hypothetical protein [Pseudomonadota bacterium]